MSGYGKPKERKYTVYVAIREAIIEVRASKYPPRSRAARAFPRRYTAAS